MVEVGAFGVAFGVGGEPAAGVGIVEAAAEVDQMCGFSFGLVAPGDEGSGGSRFFSEGGEAVGLYGEAVGGEEGDKVTEEILEGNIDKTVFFDGEGGTDFRWGGGVKNSEFMGISAEFFLIIV